MANTTPVKNPESPKRWSPRLVLGLLTLGAAGAAYMAVATASSPEEVKKSQARSSLRLCVRDTILDTGVRMPDYKVRDNQVLFIGADRKEIAHVSLLDYDVAGSAMADPAMNEKMVRIGTIIPRRCGGFARAL